jgi:hypothetical protein
VDHQGEVNRGGMEAEIQDALGHVQGGDAQLEVSSSTTIRDRINEAAKNCKGLLFVLRYAREEANMDNRRRRVFKAARSKARSEMTVLSRVLRKMRAKAKAVASASSSPTSAGESQPTPPQKVSGTSKC